MRIIFYVCDYCAKKVRQRLEYREQEPKILSPLGRYEVCESCILVAQQNLQEKLAINRLKQ